MGGPRRAPIDTKQPSAKKICAHCGLENHLAKDCQRRKRGMSSQEAKDNVAKVHAERAARTARQDEKDKHMDDTQGPT